MQASSQNPVRSDATTVFKLRDAECFCKSYRFSQGQKSSRRTTKKLLILSQITPPQCPSTKQSQSRNGPWGTKPPKLIWTSRCTDCHKTWSGAKKEAKKQEKTYIWEWIIFIKLHFFPLPALTLLLWYLGAMVQPSQPPQSPGTNQASRISLKGWLGFV